MRALILTAGLGTRLRPLTLTRAKPSLPVVGIPSFWFGAWHMKRELLELDAFAINVSHAPESMRAAAADADLRAFTGINFHVSNESSQVLGSSGALWQLSSWIGDETLAVSNGDTISFPDWQSMLESHRRSFAAITLHVRAFSNADEPYTKLAIAPNGRVMGFGEKGTDGVMFSGSYLFEPSLLSRLPSGVSELRPSLLEPLIREGKLFAYREDTDWLDTGSVQSYAGAQFELLKRMPNARDLVEVKMRELATDCWVPRDWPRDGNKIKLTAPVVMTGDYQQWLACGDSYGPRFVGIEPPLPGMSVPRSNAIVMSTVAEALK